MSTTTRHRRKPTRLWAAIKIATLNLKAVNFGVTDMSLYNKEELNDFQVIADSFNHLSSDPRPGNRKRAYSRFVLRDKLIQLEHSAYIQRYNQDARNELRNFEPVTPLVLGTNTLQHLIFTHVEIARQTNLDHFSGDLEIGVHSVRYECVGLNTAYSSPLTLHADDEPYVAVILVEVNGIAGDVNYVSIGKEKPSIGFKLQQPLDTLILGEKCLHGIGVMISNDGRPAYRDILIITIKPIQPI